MEKKIFEIRTHKLKKGDSVTTPGIEKVMQLNQDDENGGSPRHKTPRVRRDCEREGRESGHCSINKRKHEDILGMPFEIDNEKKKRHRR